MICGMYGLTFPDVVCLRGRECVVLWPVLYFGMGDPHRLHNTELIQTLLQHILINFDLLSHHT